MTSAATDAGTRAEWRELGFFYVLDHSRGRWILRGSARGIEKFASMLRAYAANPRNEMISEHDHLGPYMYLEVITALEPDISPHGISGSLADLGRFAEIIEQGVASTKMGESFAVQHDYAPKAECSLEVAVEAEDFDPPTADPLCWDAERIGPRGTAVKPTEVARGAYPYSGSVLAQLRLVRTDEQPTWSSEEEEAEGGGPLHGGPWFRVEFLSVTEPDRVASAGRWKPELRDAVREAEGAAPGLQFHR